MKRTVASQQRIESLEQPARGAVFVEPEPPKKPPVQHWFWFKRLFKTVFKPTLRIASVFFAVYIAWQAVKWVSLSDWTNPAVARIRIEAPFRWRTEAELKQRLAMLLQQRFWSLDVYALRQYLLQDPAFQKVSVEKHWPDEVRLVIEEVTPVARWGRGHVLTEQGRVVPITQASKAPEYARPLGARYNMLTNDSGPEGLYDHRSELQPQSFGLTQTLKNEIEALPLLMGGQLKSDDLIEHYRLLRRLGWPIAQLELTARGAWKVRLVDGLKIDLGSQHFSERVHKVAIIMQAYQDRLLEMQKIDARYPNGVAVKWRANNAPVLVGGRAQR
jgi:cell division protein FtsQ